LKNLLAENRNIGENFKGVLACKAENPEIAVERFMLN